MLFDRNFSIKNSQSGCGAFFNAFLLCVLTLSTGIAAADDTDVFFGQAPEDGDRRPNVLLVLDTSFSMRDLDGGSIPRLTRLQNAVMQILESDANFNIGLMQYNGLDAGGPVLFPITDLREAVCPDEGCDTTSEELYRVDGRSGDVDQRNSSSRLVRLNTNTLLFGQHQGSTNPIGLRFADINIARGATIVDARLEFVSRSNISINSTLVIEIEDVADAEPFAAEFENLTSRNFASETVTWPLSRWFSNIAYKTDDISKLVQSVVSRSDWCLGNALTFNVTTGPNRTGTNRRQAYSWETGSTRDRMPKLIITQDTSTATEAADCATAQPSFLTPLEKIQNIVEGLPAEGGTPTVGAFYEAALYMRGEGVKFGKYRGADTRQRFRVSHADSYVGGTLVRDPDCTDNDLNSVACTSEQIIGDATYISPIGGSCQPNHIVLLSDGGPTGGAPESDIRTLIGASQCDVGGSEACATDLARWLNENDQSDVFDASQTITTHTIAFNLDGTPKFLQDVATAGGGTAYSAETTDDLLAVFGEIAATVTEDDASFIAPAATVNQFNRLANRSDIYFALFKPELSPHWDGNIKRFNLGTADDGSGDVLIRDRDGNVAIDEKTGLFANTSRSFWPGKNDDGSLNFDADGSVVGAGGAANQQALTGISGIGDRRVYTWIGDPSATITSPVDLTAAEQRLHEGNAAITDQLLNIGGQGSSGAEQAQLRENLLKWVRGVDVLDSDNDGSVVDARRQMGDPMHSRPVIINYAIPNNSDTVRSLLFVGTNEGYLHALDSDTGEEQFAFVPGDLLKNHEVFYNNTGSVDRPYGLDGPISVWRNDANDNLTIDAGDTAFLFAGMRRGGNNFYALDVTDPDRPKLAWTIAGGQDGTPGFENLGQSWSRLTPVKMFINGSEKDVLILGGGYDTVQDNLEQEGTSNRVHPTDQVGNGLYIVEAATGELIWSGLGSGSGTRFFGDMEYGFNAGIRAIDINRDSYVDQIYAADSGGQIWRFDVTQNHQSNVGSLIQGGVIADISDSASSAQRRFYNEPDVALIERGGERFLTVSIGSGARANPLDEVIQDRFYMIRQYDVFEAPAVYGKSADGSSSTPIIESDLINVSDSALPITNEFGWYLDLSGAGEKVLGTSVTFNDIVFFSSFVPSERSSLCSPEIGSGRAYVLDVATGGPVLDLFNPDNNTGGLTVEDRSTVLRRGGIPPEALVLITQESLDEPQVLFGAEQLDVGLTNGTRRTFWSDQGESGEIVSSDN